MCFKKKKDNEDHRRTGKVLNAKTGTGGRRNWQRNFFLQFDKRERTGKTGKDIKLHAKKDPGGKKVGVGEEGRGGPA